MDETGRCIRDDKRGFIAEAAPLLLNQFGIDPNRWLAHVQRFGDSYGYCATNKKDIQKIDMYFIIK